jgi:hypothetical protein
MAMQGVHREPEVIGVDHVEAAINEVETAYLALGRARQREMDLDTQRHIVKVGAIRRIMQSPNDLTGKPHSVSSAEAIVELDAEFAAHRKAQSEAVLSVEAAYGAAVAAKLRAQRAVDAERLP